jgi:hypothetical protein
MELSAGGAQLSTTGADGWLTPVADLRARWRGHATALEVRARRSALGASAALLANQVVRSEAQLGVEVPVGWFRVRAGGRAAVIDAARERANLRRQGDAAVVLPMTGGGELSLQYHRIGYQRGSTAGYFAPAHVQTVELGTYRELEGDGAVSLALDLGAGAQRIALQRATAGPWKLALRGWATVAVILSPALTWRTELEAYSAPFAPAGAVTSPGWKYGALSTGVQVRLP